MFFIYPLFSLNIFDFMSQINCANIKMCRLCHSYDFLAQTHKFEKDQDFMLLDILLSAMTDK